MKKKPVEFWKETIEWIDQSWQRKKGRKYPFTGKDFNLLKLMRKYFTAPEICSLWDVYIVDSPFYGPKTGYLISGFWEERSILLESHLFKVKVQYHEKRFGLVEPKRVVKELELDLPNI